MSFCMSSVTTYSFKWVTMDVDQIWGRALENNTIKRYVTYAA